MKLLIRISNIIVFPYQWGGGGGQLLFTCEHCNLFAITAEGISF